MAAMNRSKHLGVKRHHYVTALRRMRNKAGYKFRFNTERFQLDVEKTARGEMRQHFSQRGQRRTPIAEPRITTPIDIQARQAGIVTDHRLAVSRGTDIKLHAVAAVGQRQFKGLQRIFRRAAARPARAQQKHGRILAET